MKTFPAVAVAGAVVWIGVIAGSVTGLVHLTLIDVLFLLAPLVIVPLGLRLVQFDEGLPSRLLGLAILIQPAGAVLAVVAFLIPTGIAAGVVASVWLLVCGIAALGALAHLIAGRSLHPIRLVPAAAVGFMAFGAVWLVLSRAGIRPLGLDRQIVELTAVHFHFTAFAATLLAALVLIRLRDERGTWHNVALAAAIALVLGSPVLAAGWGTPIHVLQVLGAILVATGVIGTAAIMFFRTDSLAAPGTAHALLRIAAVMPLLPMILAVEYSTGRTFGFPTLDIQTMALVHGNLNALGFVFLGLIAWTMAQPGYRRAGTVSRNAGMTPLANSSS
ncbi:MAG TPA: YndJ family transporter [Candidatus Dormibacteraeota bacterium]